MTHFLRDDKNKTIVEAEVFHSDGIEDFSVVFGINRYTILFHKLIVGPYVDRVKEKDPYAFGDFCILAGNFAKTFEDLSELRGEWFEKEVFEDNFKNVNEFVKERFSQVAKIYGLFYVTD